MATMTIRHIDDQLKARLPVHAAMHGRSMEDEARNILRTALFSEPASGKSLVDAMRARIEPPGAVDLELPAREPMRAAVDLGACARR
jgi:plasmid stability protein